MVRQENFDFWISNNYNVLLIGEAGVGKTALVKEAFDRHNLKWRYYSAPTMDPWVDLVGVPKEVKDADGNSYLDLVRPKEFRDDEIEALFFDEFNRAPKKVRNAVMELMQFKSINGKVFRNLRFIWSAINPCDGDRYDVEKLDPAQEDRFQIKVQIPYKPNKLYFFNRYGEEMANAAISWWEDLPDEEKQLVSPRRLDYALDVIEKSGDVRYVLPTSSNVSKLITTLETGPIVNKLKEFRDKNDIEGAKQFLINENNYNTAVKHIVKTSKNIEFFIPCLTNEKISKLMSLHDNVLTSVLTRLDKYENFRDIANNIVMAGTNKKLAAKITQFTQDNDIEGVNQCDQSAITAIGTKPMIPCHKNGSIALFKSIIEDLQKRITSGKEIADRKMEFDDICENMPSKLSTELALNCLEVLGWLASRSHKSTLIGWGSFFGTCNQCIHEICVNESISDWKIFLSKYSKSIMPLVNKCYSHPTLASKLYIPSQVDAVWYNQSGNKCKL